MTAESDLYSTLSGTTAVTDIVSTRIYPDSRLQSEVLPAIVFTRSSTEPMQGLNREHFCDLASVSIGCIASSRHDAGVLASAVVAAVIGTDFFYTDQVSEFDEELDAYIANINVNRYE